MRQNRTVRGLAAEGLRARGLEEEDDQGHTQADQCGADEPRSVKPFRDFLAEQAPHERNVDK
jgi:hypothetical protein